MKRLTYALLALIILLAPSCTKHDDIWDKLNDHESRIEQLEEQCRRLSSNIEALQTTAQALQKNDYLTKVVCIEENGKEIGYKMTFAQSGEVTVYTIPDGSIPQFRVSENYWYASFDNGATWYKLGKVGEQSGPEPLISDITYDDENVYLTLQDGKQLTIPFGNKGKTVDLFIFMGQSNMSGRGVASDAPVVPEGWGYEYKSISDSGKLLPMVEPFGLGEDNEESGVDDSVGTNGPKRKGSSVSSLAISYYEHTRVPVVGVSCSKGGTSSQFWMPGGNPLEDAIQRYLNAENWLKENGYTIRNNYMFWLQGENDYSSGISVDKYKANMISIVKEMIDRTGVTHCMMLRVGQPQGSPATATNNIIEAQTQLCQTYKEFVMASTITAAFGDENLLKDTWHYTQEGYNLLGTDAGRNVAYFSNNAIEPYMYDSYTQSLYYPLTKYKSISNDDAIEFEQIEIPSDGILAENMFVMLNDSWIRNSGSTFVTGGDPQYNACFLPADISAYELLQITAQDEYNTYYQFFIDDNLAILSGTRSTVEKGTTAMVAIPENAKYLVINHSRTNLTEGDGYGYYFPANLTIYNENDAYTTVGSN